MKEYTIVLTEEQIQELIHTLQWYDNYWGADGDENLVDMIKNQVEKQP